MLQPSWREKSNQWKVQGSSYCIAEIIATGRKIRKIKFCKNWIGWQKSGNDDCCKSCLKQAKPRVYLMFCCHTYISNKKSVLVSSLRKKYENFNFVTTHFFLHRGILGSNIFWCENKQTNKKNIWMMLHGC